MMVATIAIEDPWQFGQSWIGNDVVDSRDPETRGKLGERRFVERILTENERRLLDRHPTNTFLWQLWSAKEAAYKVLVKAVGARPAARHLEVVPDGTELTKPLSGTVTWRGHRISLRWYVDREYVHAVATWRHAPSGASPLVQVARSEDPRFQGHHLTRAEEQSARNSSSAAVRALAKSLFSFHESRKESAARTTHFSPSAKRGFSFRESRKESAARTTHFSPSAKRGFSSDPVGIEVLRPRTGKDFGPPRLCRDGQSIPGWDLSLSHHGRFVAVALAHAPSQSVDHRGNPQ